MYLVNRADNNYFQDFCSHFMYFYSYTKKLPIALFWFLYFLVDVPMHFCLDKDVILEIKLEGVDGSSQEVIDLCIGQFLFFEWIDYLLPWFWGFHLEQVNQTTIKDVLSNGYLLFLLVLDWEGVVFEWGCPL